MIISWIKWKLYIRWKNKWNSFKFLNKNRKGTGFWGMLLSYDFIYSLLIYLGSLAFLNWIIYSTVFPSQYEGVLVQLIIMKLEMLRQEPDILWNFFFLFLIVFSVIIGIKSSRWSEEQKDEDWLLLNTFPSRNNRRWFLLIETIVWNTRDLILKILPFLLALCTLTRGITESIITILLVMFLYYGVSIYVSFFHVFFIQLRFKLHRNIIINSVTALGVRGLTILIGFTTATYFNYWIEEFPLVSRKIDGTVYNEWLQIGLETTLALLDPLVYLYSGDYSPIKNLVSLSQGILNISSISSIMLIYLSTFAIILFFLRFLDTSPLEEKPISNLRNTLSLITKFFPIGIQTQSKLFLRSDYIIRRFPNLFGSVLFWFIIGFISSVLNSISPDNKIYYMFVSFLLFFPTYFLVLYLSEALNGKLALESDGRYVLLYLIANKSMWDIYVRKFSTFLIVGLPIIVFASIILFFLADLSIKLLLLILIVQILFLIVSIYLTFIPSLYSPHFEFSNPEQISDYPDKKILAEIINYAMLGFIIPILMLPTALFLVDSINYNLYLIGQFGIISLLLLSTVFIVYVLTRKKMNKITNIEGF